MYEALRQSSLFVNTFVNGGGKISSSVQPVDLYYYSFSFNRVFFPEYFQQINKTSPVGIDKSVLSLGTFVVIRVF